MNWELESLTNIKLAIRAGVDKIAASVIVLTTIEVFPRSSCSPRQQKSADLKKPQLCPRAKLNTPSS